MPNNYGDETAAEAIMRHLQSREAQFLAWFPEHIDEDEDGARVALDSVRALATEHGWNAPERDEDEDSDDYRDRVDEDASEYVTRERTDEGRMDNDLLSVTFETTVTVTILLSTGGPGDHITADCTIEEGTFTGEFGNVEYHYVPWFDHASVPITDASPLWALVEEHVSRTAGLGIGDVTRD